KLLQLEIDDEASFLAVCDRLHDASFDLSAMHHDSEAGEWKGLFHRESREDPELIRRTSRRVLLFFRRYDIPLVESELLLSGVRHAEVTDRSKIGRYTFNEARRHGQSWRMVFCEDMEILVTFGAGPRGVLRDTRILDKHGSGIVFWPLPLIGCEW
ncbi:MAG: hypothetical protein ACYTFI_16865, partial [Planctomycetota bacterium]